MNKKGLLSSKNIVTAPYALWMAVFVIVPIALVAYYALTDAQGNLTFENIKTISNYGGTLLLSVELAVIATFICLILAYPLAYSISKMKEKSQSVIIMFVMLPMWMNFLIRTYAWMTILEDNGLINTFLRCIAEKIGAEFEGFNMINTNGAVVLGMVYNFLPYMVLPIYTVLTKIDKSIIEAAHDLGANNFKVFTSVIVPQSIPGIISGITMVFVPAVSTFVISKLLGGGKSFLIGDIIENYFLGNAGEVNYNIGASLSLILMVLILISMSVMNHFDKDNENSNGGII